MNKNRVFDDIMHFIVHNSFLFTVATMGLVHATLLVIFVISGIETMISANILSVVVYLFCVILCRFGHIMPVYVSILLEVTIYAIFCIYYIGWNCGAHLFLFSIVPIIIYFGCFLFKGAKRWLIVILLAMNFSLFMVLFIRCAEQPPVYQVPHNLEIILTIFTTFVMVFSIIFYNTIYIYTSESEMMNLEQKNEQLSVDAKIDALTQLLNRRGFLPVVEELIKAEPRRYFCIAFCDIDNFKRINDSFGHDCGDEVLRHISRMIKKEMEGCEVCRWGGEEIVILMRDYDLAVAKEKMEYLRELVESTPTVFYNKHIAKTLTIGVEEFKETYNDPDDIIKVADARMYYGKQHGKNIVISEDISA